MAFLGRLEHANQPHLQRLTERRRLLAGLGRCLFESPQFRLLLVTKRPMQALELIRSRGERFFDHRTDLVQIAYFDRHRTADDIADYFRSEERFSRNAE